MSFFDWCLGTISVAWCSSQIKAFEYVQAIPLTQKSFPCIFLLALVLFNLLSLWPGCYLFLFSLLLWGVHFQICCSLAYFTDYWIHPVLTRSYARFSRFSCVTVRDDFSIECAVCKIAVALYISTSLHTLSLSEYNPCRALIIRVSSGYPARADHRLMFLKCTKYTSVILDPQHTCSSTMVCPFGLHKFLLNLTGWARFYQSTAGSPIT